MTESNAAVEVNPSGLTEQEEADYKFRIDRKLTKALEEIAKGQHIKGFAGLLDQDFWLREVLRDTWHENPNIRSRALMMLGQYLGILSERKGSQGRKAVKFEEEPQ